MPDAAAPGWADRPAAPHKEDLMSIKAVIFDLDGTLLNTLADLADASNWALAEMGLPTHPEEAYRHFVGDGAAMLCLRMLPGDRRDEASLKQARALFDRRYQAHMFDRTVPYEGIPALLDTLSSPEKGLSLGVVSNKPDVFVQAIAARYFPGRFAAVSGQQGAAKPDPAGVLRCLDAFGVLPKEALYVGDGAVDIQTAKNAGTHSCGAVWGFRGERELRESGAEALAYTPKDVAELVLSLG